MIRPINRLTLAALIGLASTAGQVSAQISWAQTAADSVSRLDVRVDYEQVSQNVQARKTVYTGPDGREIVRSYQLTYKNGSTSNTGCKDCYREYIRAIKFDEIYKCTQDRGPQYTWSY